MKKSNIDWCEDNYKYSNYICEYYNTLSNLLPILYSLYILKKSKCSIQNINAYHISYILLILIYTGSFLFHATLTYLGQLLDEFPMLLLILYLLYLLDRRTTLALIKYISLLLILLVIISIYPNSPYPFQISFIGINCLITVKVLKTYKKFPFRKQRKKIQLCLRYYLIASICWILDIIFCHYIKELYLHALWHILSFLGGIYLIDYVFIYLQHMHRKKLPNYIYKNMIE
jgi:hypothetical protein